MEMRWVLDDRVLNLFYRIVLVLRSLDLSVVFCVNLVRLKEEAKELREYLAV